MFQHKFSLVPDGVPSPSCRVMSAKTAQFAEFLKNIQSEVMASEMKLTSSDLQENYSSLTQFNEVVRLLPGKLSAADPQSRDLRCFLVNRGVAFMREFSRLPHPSRSLERLREQLSVVLSAANSPAVFFRAYALLAWSGLKSVHLSGERQPPVDFLSRKVGFRHGLSKGRMVVAREAVHAGETLVIESPVACVMFHVRAPTCHHCGHDLVLPLPCPGCPDVLFCSLKCLSDAGSYHKIECKIRLFGILRRLSAGQETVSCGKAIAIRLLLQRSVDFFLEQRDVFQPGDLGIASDLLPGPDVDPYHFLWSLYPLRRARDYLIVDALFSLLIHSGYFPPTLSTAEVIFFRDVARHLSRIIEANSFAIEAPTEEAQRRIYATGVSDRRFTSPVSKWQVGSGLYLRSSMFNHSCNPNAAFVFAGNRIVIAATDKIEPGGEICISYGSTFPYSPLSLRREKTLLYDFACKCEACMEDWPGWKDIPTGLVPRELFGQTSSPSKRPEDVLRACYLESSELLESPEEFLFQIKSLQIREQEARESFDVGELLAVFRDRARTLGIVKRPHFCHLKTRTGIVGFDFCLFSSFVS